jgi:predicted outer membrane lipoprotein
LPQILTIIQIGLFALPILSLFGLGVALLIKPVNVINRRWYLAVIVPLLLANPLVILENALWLEEAISLGWRFWVVVVVDILLLVGITWWFRGYLVYGLSASGVEDGLKHAFEARGLEVQKNIGVKSSLLGWNGDAQVLTVMEQGQPMDIWISERYREVLLQTDTKRGYHLLKGELSSLRETDQPYRIKAHLMGILFIIFAIVLTVMLWIFFFEPKLIQIE